MKAYFASRWFVAGLIIGVIGCGPMLFVIAMDRVGLWPNANPNPVGPGMLFLVTAWPAIICLVIGVVRTRAARRRENQGATPAVGSGTSDGAPALARHPALRMIVGVGAVSLSVYGLVNLPDSEGRGAAAAIVLGGVALYWAIAGWLPTWFGRRN